MELWLLGAGAVVLVGIALWIVWPARRVDLAGPIEPARLDQKETSMRPDESIPNDLPPQGDRFEDQYTAATGDLSAGGVATTLQHLQEPAFEATPTTPSATTGGASATGSSGGAAVPDPTGTADPTRTAPQSSTGASTYGTRPADEPWSGPTSAGDRPSMVYPAPQAPYISSAPPPSQTRLAQPRTIALGAGALLATGGAVGGAWLYSRWQRERNKPVNRLRRRARDLAGQIGDRLPDVDDLPLGTPPSGGVAAAGVLATLALVRALRGGSDETADTEAAKEEGTRGGEWRTRVELEAPSGKEARGRAVADLLDAADQRRRRAGSVAWRRLRVTSGPAAAALPSRDDLRKLGARATKRLPDIDLPDIGADSAPRSAFMRLGLGGLAVVAGVSYLVWRVLRGGGDDVPAQSWTSIPSE